MEQGGIYQITLYENKDIGFTYNASENVSAISTGGETISLANCNKNKLTLNFMRTDIGRKNIEYNLSFIIYDLDDVITNINKIRFSRYGWWAKVELLNGNTVVIPVPLLPDVSNFMTNKSNSSEFKLKNYTTTALNTLIFE